MTQKILRGRNAQAIAEFVAVLLFFSVLLYAVIDLVTAISIKHVLDSACREAARAATTQENLAADDPAIKSRIEATLNNSNLVSKLIKAEQLEILSPGLLEMNTSNGSQPGSLITVQVRARYKSIFSHVGLKEMNIIGRAYSRYVGPYV